MWWAWVSITGENNTMAKCQNMEQMSSLKINFPYYLIFTVSLSMITSLCVILNVCVPQHISKSIPTTECVISHGAEGAGNLVGSRMSTRSHHSTTASHASRYTNHTYTHEYTRSTGMWKFKHILWSECTGATLCRKMLTTVKETGCSSEPMMRVSRLERDNFKERQPVII